MKPFNPCDAEVLKLFQITTSIKIVPPAASDVIKTQLFYHYSWVVWHTGNAPVMIAPWSISNTIPILNFNPKTNDTPNLNSYPKPNLKPNHNPNSTLTLYL